MKLDDQASVGFHPEITSPLDHYHLRGAGFSAGVGTGDFSVDNQGPLGATQELGGEEVPESIPESLELTPH